MLRFLLAVVGGLIIAGILLGLRGERLRSRHQIALLHQQLLQRQATLWRQQLEIAAFTSPEVVDTLSQPAR
jgi:hypothetical protein